jgi:hypothetical protein
LLLDFATRANAITHAQMTRLRSELREAKEIG